MAKDKVLERMQEYIENAKLLLEDDGGIEPTVFSEVEEGVLVLPIYHQDDGNNDQSTNLISQVLNAYNCKEYFVVVESYRMAKRGREELEVLDECVNVLYTDGKVKKLLSIVYKRLNAKEFFFGDTVEIKPSNVNGSLLDLFNLFTLAPKLTKKEKANIRIMFPMESEDDLESSSHNLN